MMEKPQVLKTIRESRKRGTCSPFVGAADREAEIDKVLIQLEASLIEPEKAKVVSAHFPQEDRVFLKNQGVFAVAKSGDEYLLHSVAENLFAKAWKSKNQEFTILGFSSSDAIAEWRG